MQQIPETMKQIPILFNGDFFMSERDVTEIKVLMSLEKEQKKHLERIIKRIKFLRTRKTIKYAECVPCGITTCEKIEDVMTCTFCHEKMDIVYNE